nr:MAG TPA: hypothetical protein [Caudoviricetes sp.]
MKYRKICHNDLTKLPYGFIVICIIISNTSCV